MTKEIRLYVEGGGDESQGKARIREGLSRFLRPVVQRCRESRVRWNVIACGPRNSAYEAFCAAGASHPGATSLLLVGAEHPVLAEPWQHLRDRDQWATKRELDSSYHLMVLTMESWLVADPDALEQYYGKGFRRSALPPAGRIEELPKAQIRDCLRRATEQTKKGEYHKIRHGPEILGALDSNRVRRAAPHCDRLFQTLYGFIAP